jgi:hypothetical protein
MEPEFLGAWVGDELSVFKLLSGEWVGDAIGELGGRHDGWRFEHGVEWDGRRGLVEIWVEGCKGMVEVVCPGTVAKIATGRE